MFSLNTPSNKYGLSEADKVGKGVTPNKHILAPDSFALVSANLRLVLAIFGVGREGIIRGANNKHHQFGFVFDPWTVYLLL